MIRLYAYYSCGGYKDMYLGGSDTAASPSYFLPLLPVMRKRGRADEVEKIRYQESLQHVCIVTGAESYGFPADAANMFSHGAYKAVYRTLQDGSSCLSMHDIPSDETDEEGRDIPFTLMFVADGEHSVMLDFMAAALLKDMASWQELFTSLFAYDPTVNGVKFDLPKIMAKVHDTKQESDCYIDRTQSRNVAFLMLNGNNGVKTALKEQNLKREEVSCFVDTSGNVIEGRLPLVKEEKKLTAAIDGDKDVPEKEKTPQKSENMPTVTNDHSVLEHLTYIEKLLEEMKGKSSDNVTSDRTEIERLINEINNRMDISSVKEQLERLHDKEKNMTLYLIVITTIIAILQIINLL